MLRHLPFITRNALRHRRRSLLTITSIAVTLCVLGTMLAVYQGLFNAEPATPSQAVRLVSRHRVSLTQALPVSYKQRILQVPGVVAANCSQWFGGVYRDKRPENQFARFVVEPKSFFQVHPDVEIAPEQREAFERTRTGCIASSQLAQQMKWSLGERITVVGDIFPMTLELTLVGTFDEEDGFPRLYAGWDYFQEGLPKTWQGNAGTIEVLADSPDHVARVAKDIDAMFANSSAATKTDTEMAFFLQFLAMLGPIKLFLAMISGAVIFTILMVSANTVAMSVREQTRETAILRTLGYTPGEITGLILGEAVLLSFLGGALGALLATGLLTVLGKAPIPFPFPPMTVGLAAAVIAVALVIGLLSAVVPALLASRKPVVEAIRFAG
jgi:putative ABC transport system permease protein